MKFYSINDYGYDINSFLFSINRLEKYPKNNYNYSIWCYKDYGPCLNYDLQFIKYKMNIIKFSSNAYYIPDPFFQKKDDYLKDEDNSDIFLDSLEIFEIIGNKKENQIVK